MRDALNWSVLLKDGRTVKEYEDDGTENNLGKIPREEIVAFRLYDPAKQDMIAGAYVEILPDDEFSFKRKRRILVNLEAETQQWFHMASVITLNAMSLVVLSDATLFMTTKPDELVESFNVLDETSP